MTARLSNISKLLISASAALLLVVIFVPIWRIELTAPQYPEGLVLKISASALGGDVNVINGLNHYIGMKTLHTNDFPEFTFLPYLLAFFAGFGLLTIIINRKKIFYSWLILLLVFAAGAMIDFYRWNYNYGHNLNPEAPIRVPGMSYQPPLIGYKQLLNFGAFSVPDIGGWILIVVYLLLAIAFFLEVRKPSGFNSRVSAAYVLPVVFVLFYSCSAAPNPIVNGRDGCDYCKMTVTDARFAAQMITSKGKPFIFDDLHCLKEYIHEHPEKVVSASFYLVDYTSQHLIPAVDAVLIRGEQFHSPMGSNTVAFATPENAKQAQINKANTTVSWNSILTP